MGYWLREWIDSEGINTIEDARLRLKDKRSMDLLVSLCAHQAQQGVPELPEAAQQLVTGRGMDLSGTLECGRGACLKKRVDEVLYRTWHFFDKIVVTGMDSRRFMHMLQLESPDSISQLHLDLYLLPQIEVALYVRDIGADDALIFLDRPYAMHLECVNQVAQEIGLVGDFMQVVEQLANVLYDGHRLKTIRQEDDTLVVAFCHPFLDAEGLIDAVHVRGVSASQEMYNLARQRAYNAAWSLTASTVSNAALARKLSAALGQLTVAEPSPLQQVERNITPEDVAFNLSLPVLESVPIKEVLSFRTHEAADFQAFRAALKAAVNERIRALPGADAEHVANSVYEDLLEPVLINLDRKTKKAAELLAKRCAISTTVGAALTTVGLLSFVPIAVAGVTISASGLVAGYHEFLKDRREIELADLYFLWRLTDRVAQHAD